MFFPESISRPDVSSDECVMLIFLGCTSIRLNPRSGGCFPVGLSDSFTSPIAILDSSDSNTRWQDLPRNWQPWCARSEGRLRVRSVGVEVYRCRVCIDESPDGTSAIW